MSAPINTARIFNMAGELNPTATRNIIWNILDNQPHKAYLAKTNETNLIWRQLLQTLAIAAGICHQAIAITTLAANSYCAAVSLSNPMKTQKVQALEHISEMTNELAAAANMNTEHHTHAIIMKIIDMLEALPNEGNILNIEGANRIIRAYHDPTPTRPSSTENVDMEPIPIPAPRPTLSRWHDILTRLQPSTDKANKENISPATPTRQISGWNEPTL